MVISHLPDFRPPKLAPLERLPKRHRVGPSASLDEYRILNCGESLSQGSGHVNFAASRHCEPRALNGEWAKQSSPQRRLLRRVMTFLAMTEGFQRDAAHIA